MSERKTFSKETVFILGVMVLLLLTAVMPRGDFQLVLFLITVISTLALLVWRWFDFGRSIFRWIATIGKASHPKLFGIAQWKFYLTAFAIFIPFVFILDAVLTRREFVYTESLADLRHSPEGTNTLGENIQVGWMIQNSYETVGDEGSAEIVAPVHGSVSHGKLFAKAVETNGKWRLVKLYLVKDGDVKEVEIAH